MSFFTAEKISDGVTPAILATVKAASTAAVAADTALVVAISPNNSVTTTGSVGINTGTNTIGSVKLTDGTNVATVKAGSVAALASDTAVVVTTNGSTTSNAPVNSSVTSTSSTILAANVARREFTIVNTDVVVVYIGLGQTPTATAYHIALSPCTVAHNGTGGTYTSDIWKGAVNVIVASTSGHAAATEMT